MTSVLFAALMAPGVVWHVSPSGSDSRSGRTPQGAFATLQKAADVAGPGDTVKAAKGIYRLAKGQEHLAITRSGEEGRPITFTGDPGGGTILINNEAWHAIKTLGARHIVIQHFEVRGGGPSVPKEEALKEMDNLGNPRTSGNGIGILAEGDQASAHVTVRRCRVDGMPGGGIYVMKSDWVTIVDNHVTRCGFTSPYANSGISVYQPRDVDQEMGVKIRIERNISSHNRNDIPFYFSNPEDRSKRMITDGNGIILDDFQASQSFVGSSGRIYGGQALVANNIVMNNGGSGIHAFLSQRVFILHNWAENNNQTPSQKDGQIFSNSGAETLIAGNVMIAAAGKPVTSNYNNKAGVVMKDNLFWSVDGKAPEAAGLGSGNRVAAPGASLAITPEGAVGWRFERNTPLRGLAPRSDLVLKDFHGKRRQIRTSAGPLELPQG